jgi:hypothetical protein
MRSQYLYDVAISFAEEDRSVAVSLALALEMKGFKNVYYYPDRQDETWGANLELQLKEIYLHKAQYALVLLSDNYFEKYFTAVEYNAIQQRQLTNKDKVYALPIVLGNYMLGEDSFFRKTGFLRWNHEPKYIAGQVKIRFAKEYTAVHPLLGKIMAGTKVYLSKLMMLAVVVGTGTAVYFALGGAGSGDIDSPLIHAEITKVKDAPATAPPKKNTQTIPRKADSPVVKITSPANHTAKENSRPYEKDIAPVPARGSKNNTLATLLSGSRYENGIYYLSFIRIANSSIAFSGKIEVNDISGEAAVGDGVLTIKNGDVVGYIVLKNNGETVTAHFVVKETGTKITKEFRKTENKLMLK